MLTQSRLKELLNYDPDTGEFTWLKQTGHVKPGAPAGYVRGQDDYISIMVDKRNYKAHRLAWLYVHGDWPEHGIDHCDRCRTNNRIANLRPATAKQNAENRNPVSMCVSGRTGVHWNPRRRQWQAKIRHQKQLHLGWFFDLEKAIAARVEAERRLFTHAPSCEAAP